MKRLASQGKPKVTWAFKLAPASLYFGPWFACTLVSQSVLFLLFLHSRRFWFSSFHSTVDSNMPLFLWTRYLFAWNKTLGPRSCIGRTFINDSPSKLICMLHVAIFDHYWCICVMAVHQEWIFMFFQAYSEHPYRRILQTRVLVGSSTRLGTIQRRWCRKFTSKLLTKGIQGGIPTFGRYNDKIVLAKRWITV